MKIDRKRMDKALNARRFTMPPGLSREQKRDFVNLVARFCQRSGDDCQP